MAEVEKTGNAVRDGAVELDRVMGEGTAERWANFVLGNGGLLIATPWVLFIGFPRDEDPRTLYVSYLYGDRRAVADASKMILDSGYFDRVEFRKCFTKETGDTKYVFDRRLVERMWRLSRRKEERG